MSCESNHDTRFLITGTGLAHGLREVITGTLSPRLWGEPVNLREQHDALEFFNNLVDNLDEGLKALSGDPLFSNILGGSFADQKICKGCPHRYEMVSFEFSQFAKQDRLFGRLCIASFFYQIQYNFSMIHCLGIWGGSPFCD